MKKLLTVVAVLAAIAGSAFAKENFIEIGVGLPRVIQSCIYNAGSFTEYS